MKHVYHRVWLHSLVRTTGNIGCWVTRWCQDKVILFLLKEGGRQMFLFLSESLGVDFCWQEIRMNSSLKRRESWSSCHEFHPHFLCYWSETRRVCQRNSRTNGLQDNQDSFSFEVNNQKLRWKMSSIFKAVKYPVKLVNVHRTRGLSFPESTEQLEWLSPKLSTRLRLLFFVDKIMEKNPWFKHMI